MIIYAVIGIFLGPKWYIAPMFFIACFLFSGKILHMLTTRLPIKSDQKLIKGVLSLYTIIHFTAALFAYITWF